MDTIETVGQITNDIGSIESILSLICGLVIGLYRARQNRVAGHQIVRAIETAKTTDQIVNFADTGTAGLINTVISKRGKQIVDEAQGKRRAKPF